MNKPFIYGERYQDPYPLEKYLPANFSGITKSWLDQLSSQSKLVLFPFGGSPAAIAEAARSGYRCIAPIYNPITRFLINRLAQPISKDRFNSALVHLASSFRGKDRIKPYILSLYETDCPSCGGRISARSFTWSRAKKEPIQKTCLCPDCSEYSESAITQEDRDKALSYQENSPTYARALTRVTAPDDPIRQQVENALQAYTPRSLFALFIILNKLTGFELNEDERLVLETLLLHAFYRCSSPNSSTESGTYIEENVWFVLEETSQIWASGEKTIPISTWPDLPPEAGGISIYPKRVKNLLPKLTNIDLGAVWMVFPKPTLSYWALSALWTGWLWGQAAASPLHNILSLEDYSWTWLTKAVESTLSDLWELIPDGTPCFGLIPDLEIDSLFSSITSATSAGLSLENISLDPDLGQGQTIWRIAEPAERDTNPEIIRETIRSAGFDLLNDSGEPKDTINLYGAGMAALSTKNLLPQYQAESLVDQYNKLNKDFEENIAYRQGYLHFPKSDTWWHQDLVLNPVTDSDQVEQSLVEYLVKSGSTASRPEIYSHLYQSFPGLRTPRSGLIQACLHSYAEQTDDNDRNWKIKKNDRPDQRRKDLAEIKNILSSLGEHLKYQVVIQPPIGNIVHITWNDNEDCIYSYYVSASGILNKIITHPSESPMSSWIIIPGSRADLIHFKIQYNPPLASALEEGWELIKYRHIRRLNKEGGLTRENLKERLILDPFISDSPQMQLI